MSFSTVLQSYQDDGRVIMKAVCTQTPFTVEKRRPPRGGGGGGGGGGGLKLATARSVGQLLTH